MTAQHSIRVKVAHFTIPECAQSADRLECAKASSPLHVLDDLLGKLQMQSGPIQPDTDFSLERVQQECQ